MKALNICCILLLGLIVSCISANGQQFYVNTNTGDIRSVTIANSSCSYQTMSYCAVGAYSVAQLGKTFYYHTATGSLYKSTVSTNTISGCTLLGNIGTGANALTVFKDSTLYYAKGLQLYKINPASPTPVLLGTMPYGSGGDLTFYKNQLYMAASTGIVKVDMADPSKSTMYLPVPNNPYGSLYGLVTVFANNTTVVYALGSAGAGTNIIALDMDNKIIKGITCTLPFTVYDAASVAENGVKQILIDTVTVNQKCDQYNKGKLTLTCKPDTGTYTITYKLNNNISNTTGIFDGLSPGSYSLNISSSTGANKDTVITVPNYSLSKPVIQVNKTNPLCSINGTIQFSTTNNNLYTIQYGTNIFPLNHSFTSLTAGAYHFTALNQGGCIVDTLYVNLTKDVCEPIIIDSISITPTCNVLWKGHLQVFCAPHTNIYTYYLNQNIVNTTGAFDTLAAGNYTLKIKSTNGLEKDTVIYIADYRLSKPTTLTQVKNQLCDFPGSIALKVNGFTDSTYKVKLPTTGLFPSGHIFIGLLAGTYNFSVFNKNGCILDTLSATLLKDNCSPLIFPNSFTPNGDGVNDVFKPNSDGYAKNYTLSVYNRWGASLFSSTNVNTGWDGLAAGKNAPTATYYWVATYISIDGKKQFQRGYITLIR